MSDTEKMKIPEAAVEAAAVAWSGPREWYAHSDEWRDDRLEDAKSALEAAAPHMLADAWEAGAVQHYTSQGWNIEDATAIHAGMEPENPYRTAK